MRVRAGSFINTACRGSLTPTATVNLHRSLCVGEPLNSGGSSVYLLVLFSPSALNLSNDVVNPALMPGNSHRT